MLKSDWMQKVCVNRLFDNDLGPVFFVVQAMSDISKQDCIHNKQIPQCTKMTICIHLQ